MKEKRDLFGFKPWSRQGGILTVAGIAYIVMGVVYLFHNPSESQSEALYYAFRIMPLDAWGVGFVTIGVLSIISSRWPSWSKSWGYAVLTGWSVAWGLFYLFGAILTDAKVVYFGSAGIWFLLGFLWWGVSGLVSPTEEVT